MKKADIVQRLVDPGIIAILRADCATDLVAAIRAIAAGGITAIEVTMTTPGALRVIGEARAALDDSIVMGVGTVLDPETVRQAVRAGAQFAITPVMRPGVIAACKECDIPVATGAMTPTEALNAHDLGSDFIKIFPAENLGPAYIRALLAPLPMLQIIPTGGVTPQNTTDYLTSGCVAVGAGSTLLQRADLSSRAWDRVTGRAAEFVTAARKACRK